jgi:hypothetical protein
MDTLAEIQQFCDADAATYDRSASHHPSTALDLSAQMLDKLRHKAASESLNVESIEGSLTTPAGGFDAIIERHLV